jgi:hypothetical protein
LILAPKTGGNGCSATTRSRVMQLQLVIVWQYWKIGNNNNNTIIHVGAPATFMKIHESTLNSVQGVVEQSVNLNLQAKTKC